MPRGIKSLGEIKEAKTLDKKPSHPQTVREYTPSSPVFLSGHRHLGVDHVGIAKLDNRSFQSFFFNIYMVEKCFQ